MVEVVTMEEEVETRKKTTTSKVSSMMLSLPKNPMLNGMTLKDSRMPKML